MLLQNCTYREMCQKLSASFPVISKDVTTIFRLHNVKGHGYKARRALAKFLNVPFQTTGDQIGQKIAGLVETGLTYKQVAKQVGLTKWSIWFHMAKLKKQTAAEPAPIAAAIPSPSGRGSG